MFTTKNPAMQAFKKLLNTPVVLSTEKEVLSKQEINEKIEEIHESFYTEVDRLLADAKISHSLFSEKEALISKYERLKALGFTNTKEADEARTEIDRLKQLERDNAAKHKLIEAITYFSDKYPTYKFITEDSVKKICSKYGLIYGAIEHYIGTVPDKNLKEIENFKIHTNDRCLYDTIWNYRPTYFGVSERNQHNNWKVSPLEIAAPITDFNTKSMNIEGFELKKVVQLPDPIVLQPVTYVGHKTKYYLIITAWGIEADDELLQ